MTEISQIIYELSQPLPSSDIKTLKRGGTTISYIPHYIVKRRLNEVCPDWSGEVRQVLNVSGKVAVVYRLAISGVSREAIGYEDDIENLYGDPFSNAEAMAFKRAAAWFGLGLYLYDKGQPAHKPQPHHQPQRQQPVGNGRATNGELSLAEARQAYERLRAAAIAIGIDAPMLPDQVTVEAIQRVGAELKEEYLAKKRELENHDPPL